MTSYSIIAQRFNDEFRNGSTFLTDPTTVYTTDLQGNVGDRIKLTQTIEIAVSVNPDQIQTMTYNPTADATYGEFVGVGINFMSEGMYVGAVLNIDCGLFGVQSCTVGLIYGTGYNKIKVTKANLITAGLTTTTTRTDFRFRLTSVPDTLIYKYGLNPNGFTGTNYTSWLDDTTTQGYYINNLTGSLQTMTRIGLGAKFWDLGTVQAKYDTTVSTYNFQYTVEHIFRIPFYLDGEYDHIFQGTPPTRFAGTASVTYDNGWFFGGTITGEYIKAELKGGIGSVGYFGENFNGYANNYEVQSVVITNADNSGVLEGSVANTITFSVKKNDGNWIAATDSLIIRHAKLPTETEYTTPLPTFDTTWIYDQVAQLEGAAAAAGTAVITACTVTINADPTLLDVSLVVTYDSTEQLLISDTSNYLLFVTAGVTPAAGNDRVTLSVDLNQFSKNLDISGLITGVDVEFFEPFEAFTGSRRLASWTGWNGDLGGCKATVTRAAYAPLSALNNKITKAEFKMFATNGTETAELLSINVPIYPNPSGIFSQVEVVGYAHQIINSSVVAGFNMPATEQLNLLQASSTIPIIASATQVMTFFVGFQTPWREWIQNLNIPNTFYDSAEAQNNQNYRTSNYSNVDSYEIFAAWYFTVTTLSGISTIYRKLTFESNVADFDTSGGAYTGSTLYYDESNQLTQNIFIDQTVRIEISFTHSSGIITLADIEGYIWIERDGSDQAPWFLHTSKDWTNALNPLSPSDTLNTGNYQFVEVVSSNNLIKLICYTNRDNLQDGVNYKVYGRIKNETLA